MANTSSAKKAIRNSAKKKQVNDVVRLKVKTAVKDFLSAVDAKKKSKELNELLSKAYKQIDKAAKRTVKVYSPNKAARMKSRLSKKIES